MCTPGLNTKHTCELLSNWIASGSWSSSGLRKQRTSHKAEGLTLEQHCLGSCDSEPWKHWEFICPGRLLSSYPPQGPELMSIPPPKHVLRSSAPLYPSHPDLCCNPGLAALRLPQFPRSLMMQGQMSYFSQLSYTCPGGLGIMPWADSTSNPKGKFHGACIPWENKGHQMSQASVMALS